MRSKNKATKSKISLKSKRDLRQPREYETMSQIQNRYGKGKAHNGSDGSTNDINYSNH
jgi:hypothetical protein